MSQDFAERVAQALGDSYRLGEKLGQGGMGVVYRGTDLRLHRDVAIKILPPELAYREELRKRFIREAQLAAGLSHPHIVPIHDVGHVDDMVWFAMGYVDGESVRDRVERDGPLSQALTRRIVREVAWALAYAHARGIVHRDIKPENILLERATGRALVTDFGIAKATEAETAGLTAPGAVIGSLQYMAPEQAGGEGVDGRADLYALGLVAYYMLSGKAPFERVTVMNVATRALSDERPDFGELERRPEPQLRAVLERCVAPHPGDRWPDAERMLEALGTEEAPAQPMPSPIRRLVRDFMLIPTFGLIVLVAAVITEDPSVPQFIFAMLLILAVNFIVSLRSFSRREYGWPELRDAVDMEVLRQSEELGATAALRERFRAIVYVAFAGAVLAGLLGLESGGVTFEGPPLFLWVVGPLVAILGAWLVIRVTEALAGLGARFIPSLPKPESSSRLARLEDRLLTFLFQPIRFGRGRGARTERSRVAAEVSDARATVAAIGARWREVPKSLRESSGPAPELARLLAHRIDAIRRSRMTQSLRAERDMERLDVASREAEVALGQLHAAVETSASNEDAAADEITPALQHAWRVLGSELPGTGEAPVTPGQQIFPTFRWLGWLVDRIAATRARAPTIPQKDAAILAQWPDVQSHLDEGARRVTRVREMKTRGGFPLTEHADGTESTAAYEAALRELVSALNRYRAGDLEAARAITEHLACVRELGARVDAILEAEAASSTP